MHFVYFVVKKGMQETFEGKEAGLKRELSVRLLSMIAIGQSIGTGLFLGSGISVQMAGPGVIVSYLIGGLITYFVMLALSEMAAAHPMAGSFGAYAEHYLGPWAGLVTRYTYSAAQIIAIGGQIVAAAIYCRYWFPDTPSWIWIAGFSAVLLAVNILNVGSFGEFEYWFSLIKVLAICFLLVFGVVLFAGIGVPRRGLEAYTAYGGFFPHGFGGVWAAVTMAIFSYYGLEAAAVGSGEAKDPKDTVPRALRRIMARLALFYVGGTAILVGIVPWNQTGISESPFVLVYRIVGIPGAAALMNFVVLTAALSSINTNLYTASRMLFSLARSGQAPALLGRLSARGVPQECRADLGRRAGDRRLHLPVFCRHGLCLPARDIAFRRHILLVDDSRHSCPFPHDGCSIRLRRGHRHAVRRARHHGLSAPDAHCLSCRHPLAAGHFSGLLSQRGTG